MTDFTHILHLAEKYTVVPEDKLRRIFNCIADASSVPGCLVELGVFRGGSAMVMAMAGPEKTLHLFDTFAGIPDVGPRSQHGPGEFAASQEDVRSALSGLQNITWHVGVFPDTWEDLGPVAVSHCDCDTYFGTMEFLKRIYEATSPGGFIVIDDYRWTYCEGVTDAVDEFFADKPEVVGTPVPNQAIVQKL